MSHDVQPDASPTNHHSVLARCWALLLAGLESVLIGAVRVYQRLVSPLLGPRCRFYPSCSSYAVTALRVHGPFVGLYLAVVRVLRCNPWNFGGVDDVPPKGWRRRRTEADASGP